MRMSKITTVKLNIIDYYGKEKIGMFTLDDIKDMRKCEICGMTYYNYPAPEWGNNYDNKPAEIPLAHICKRCLWASEEELTELGILV